MSTFIIVYVQIQCETNSLKSHVESKVFSDVILLVGHRRYSSAMVDFNEALSTMAE